jgi:hypothetical protein
MRLLRALIPLLLILGILAFPTPAVAVGISVGIAPPPLPIYEQPLIPGPGYIWTPGYWAWGPEGYYWVPGTWVLPPAIGLLWTPPWWGWGDGGYLWHAGYWGPEIGFYGGINYGFGYFGHGYDGGYWDHGRFFYNREVNNIRNANITNVYSRSVSNGGSANRVSFNGGTGGVNARPTAQEQAAMHGRHLQATGAQLQQLNAARSNRSLLATANHGNPPITATNRAGRFNSTGNATSLGATRQSSIQPNTRTTQGTVGAGARASRTFGQASTRNVTRTAPSHFGQAAPRSFTRTAPSTFARGAPRNSGPAAPRNFGRSAPSHFGQAAPGSFGQRGPSAIHSANVPHFGGQRAVGPSAHPAARVGGGAVERRHGP